MSKIVGPEFAYTDALNHLTHEHITKQDAEGNNFQKSPLRPSAAGKCERELAYELMEFRGLAKYEKELIKPDLHRLFALGHSIEYHILQQFKEQFKHIDISIRYQQQALSFKHLESKIDPKFDAWIEGSIDFVLWSKDFKAIGDVKSKKEKFSSYRDSSWEDDFWKYSKMKSLQKIGEDAFYADDVISFLDEVNDPFLAMNFMQLNLYAMNPFIVERKIDHCVLIYYSKNTSRVRELRFRPSQELYDYVINKFTNVFNAIENNDLESTKKEFTLGSMKCAFCSYKSVCWSDEDPLKAFFKNLPPKRWPKDTSKMGDEGIVLEELYETFKHAEVAAEDLPKAENELLELLTELKVDKIRFADGNIYEVKLYKSPREHFRLKRGKV